MMKYFVIFVVINFVYISLSSANEQVLPKQCCNNDTNMLINRKCEPDKNGKRTRVHLECSDRYILNPHDFPDEEKYTVSENGTLSLDDLESVAQHHEYCLVNLNDTEIDETYEIAIICFPQTMMDMERSKLTPVLKSVLIILSVLFLLLTLHIYLMLPELRETQDKATIFTLICLTIFLLCLGILQFLEPIEVGYFDTCVGSAFIVYFFTMGYFAWLNCIVANVWKTIVLRRFKANERRWYILNHIYAWSVAIIMTFVVAREHNVKPLIGINSCWFHHDNHLWQLLYLPISIMLAINVLLIIWTILCLVKSDFSPDTRKALRYKCILYLKIFLLGGFTWIFEVLSYTFNNHSPTAWLWFCVDIFNCLHGVLIFFVLILWRQRIRKELAGKRIFFYRCPIRWADVDDEEQVCLDNEDKGKYDLIIKTLK